MSKIILIENKEADIRFLVFLFTEHVKATHQQNQCQ